MEAFNERLRKALGVKNLRACDLSRLSGISQSSISQYLKGVTKPSTKQAVRIAKAIDVNIDYLLGLDDNIEKSCLEELVCKVFKLSEEKRYAVMDFINFINYNDSNTDEFYSWVLQKDTGIFIKKENICRS